MSKIIKKIDHEVVSRTAARCKAQGITIPTFAQIVDEFLEANGGAALDTLKVKYTRSAACFSLAGRALRKRWQEHHDAEAVLKGVCHACNCSKGSGGYRHKRKTKED